MAENKFAAMKFMEVESAEIAVGSFTDRPLFVYLETNDKYLCLVKPYRALDASLVEKLKTYKKIYSSLASADQRYHELLPIINSVSILIDKEDAAFEKNRKIFNAITPVVEKVLRDTSTSDWDPTATESGLIVTDPWTGVFFMMRLFGSPKFEQMHALEGHSLECFEKSLQRAALCALFAMLIGYNQREFMARFIHGAFLQELRSVSGENAHEVLKDVDDRFASALFAAQTTVAASDASIGIWNDELIDLMNYSRWLLEKSDLVFESMGKANAIRPMPPLRVYKKIKKVLMQIFKMGDHSAKAAA